jgi:hypothetical protein
MCLHHTTAIFCAVKPTQHHLNVCFVCSQCTQGMPDAMAKDVCVVLSPTCQTVSICVCFVSVLLYLRTREKQRKNVSNHPWSSSMVVFVCAQHFWDVYEDVRSSLQCLMRCFTPHGVFVFVFYHFVVSSKVLKNTHLIPHFSTPTPAWCECSIL